MKAKSNQVNQWLPVALCCVPGVTVAAIVGVGAILGGAWVSGPIGTGLIALGVLACPVSHSVLMRRMSHNAQPGDATLGADCCAPAASNNLASLQAQREALEKEVAELETN
jgi:hypothetical protein